MRYTRRSTPLHCSTLCAKDFNQFVIKGFFFGQGKLVLKTVHYFISRLKECIYIFWKAMQKLGESSLCRERFCPMKREAIFICILKVFIRVFAQNVT